MTKKLYYVRLSYQALLADGRATSVSEAGDVSALDAEAALLDALRVFREEREKRPEVIEVWGLRVNATLASVVERQEYEGLLSPQAPEETEPAETMPAELSYCPDCGYGPCGFADRDRTRFKCSECGEIFTPAEALSLAEAERLYPLQERD